MTKEIIIAILSSSLISGILGVGLTGWFSLRAKINEYLNEYFKIILAKRVKAYEAVERLVADLKVAILEDAQDPYHTMFSDSKNPESLYKFLLPVMAETFWLSSDLF